MGYWQWIGNGIKCAFIKLFKFNFIITPNTEMMMYILFMVIMAIILPGVVKSLIMWILLMVITLIIGTLGILHAIYRNDRTEIEK